MSTDDADREAKLEVIISYLLIAGVVSAVILEAVGISLYFGAFGNLQYSQAQNVYITGDNFFAFAAAQIQLVFTSHSAVLFMTLGIIILILTPYARAIASLAYFAWEGNRKYVVITLFVLVVLTISLIVH
jgi:Predicted membrane protein